MKKNLLTLAVWMVAGPNVAAKTHKIATQIDKSRKRRKVVQPRISKKEHARAIIIIDGVFSN